MCRLRRLPVANFGQEKVLVTHHCTFDHHFRASEPGQTVMGCRYRHQRKQCWGCFFGVKQGDLL
jgi:hypothetical protein